MIENISFIGYFDHVSNKLLVNNQMSNNNDQSISFAIKS